MSSLVFPAICLVTDRQRLTRSSDDDDALVRLAESAVSAGIDLIQVRERGLDDRRLLALIRRIVAASSGTRTSVVVNDRLDLALAAGAAGVHLRGDSIDAARIRTITAPGFIVGQSVHSVSEAQTASRTGVDYLVMGSVYPTTSKKEPITPVGEAGLEAVCRAASAPVLAIGGITLGKVREVAGAGASGVAAIGLFSDTFNEHADTGLEAAVSIVVATIRRAFAA